MSTKYISEITSSFEKLTLESQIKYITENPTKKIQYIMRGVPGSGKSTYARNLIASIKGPEILANKDLKRGYILSTDDFFINEQGEYNFNPEKLVEYHKKNKEDCEKLMKNNTTPIIIDNTNINEWEIIDYYELGLAHGYEILIINPSDYNDENNQIVTKEIVELLKMNEELILGRGSTREEKGKNIPPEAILGMIQRINEKMTIHPEDIRKWNLTQGSPGRGSPGRGGHGRGGNSRGSPGRGGHGRGLHKQSFGGSYKIFYSL